MIILAGVFTTLGGIGLQFYSMGVTYSSIMTAISSITRMSVGAIGPLVDSVTTILQETSNIKRLAYGIIKEVVVQGINITAPIFNFLLTAFGSMVVARYAYSKQDLPDDIRNIKAGIEAQILRLSSLRSRVSVEKKIISLKKKLDYISNYYHENTETILRTYKALVMYLCHQIGPVWNTLQQRSEQLQQFFESVPAEHQRYMDARRRQDEEAATARRTAMGDTLRGLLREHDYVPGEKIAVGQMGDVDVAAGQDMEGVKTSGGNKKTRRLRKNKQRKGKSVKQRKGKSVKHRKGKSVKHRKGKSSKHGKGKSTHKRR